jgi:hypothetical protein
MHGLEPWEFLVQGDIKKCSPIIKDEERKADNVSCRLGITF